MITHFKNFIGKTAQRGIIFALFGGILLFVSESLTAISIPLFLVNLDLLSGENLPLFLQELPRSLLFSVSCIFFCVLLRSTALAICQYVAGHVHHSFIAHQRKKLIRIGISQRSVVNSHTILYFINDVILPMGISFQSLAQGVSFAASAIILTIFGFIYAPQESAFSVILIALTIIPLRFLDKKINLKGQETSIYSKKLMQSLTEGFKLFFLFKLYGQLNKVVSNTEKNISKYDQTHKSYVLANVIKANISLVIGSFILCLTTFISNRYFDTSGAKLLTFFYIFIRVIQYNAAIIFDSSGFIFHFPKMKELHRWVTQQNEIIEKTKKIIPASSVERQIFKDVLNAKGFVIEAKEISFAYPESKPLFEKINFSVSQSSPLLIKGRSGVGKSTLLMLILGHLEPTDGQIHINDLESTKVKELLHNHIGYVGAESYIIEGSVRENLFLGHQDPSLSDDELWNILEDVQLDQDIKQLKNGLNHNLLEFTQLSTGQKQRLAIARALLRKPKLLLLDEATANLDQVTEENFIDVLTPQLKNMTAVVISHKSSFDRIVNKDQCLEISVEHQS